MRRQNRSDGRWAVAVVPKKAAKEEELLSLDEGEGVGEAERAAHVGVRQPFEGVVAVFMPPPALHLS